MVIGVLAVGVTTAVFIALSLMLLIAERYLVNYGTCIVSLNDGSVVFEVTGGGTLLSALYERKIFIPSACGGKGSCGYCKVTVFEGGGPTLPTETPFMTRAELRQGVRLACQVKIKENIQLQIPEEMLNVKEYRARVSQMRTLTYDIKEVTLELIEPNEIKARPGQYVQIMAPAPDGPVYRAYSISSASSVTDKVQLVVRLVPGGIGSTYIHNLRQGDEVYFTGPFGEFRLNDDPQVDIVLVGGGAGMAPITNIAHSIYERWPQRTCYLFFGCRTTDDVFYLDEFKKLSKNHPNFKVFYALSDPLEANEKWDGDSGFIHLSVDKRLPATQKRQAFLCGPPPMIEAVTEILENKGLKDVDIFYDKF